MKTKPRLGLALLIVLLGTICNLFFSTALQNLLSGFTSSLAFPSPSHSLHSLLSSKPHLLLFFCFQSLVIVLATLFFVFNNQPYQSELKQVAPGIETPVPTGQHQHGSARWIREDELLHLFDNETLDLQHPYLQKLIATGYEDLTFLNQLKKEGVANEPPSP
ncbi:hypothetical protein BSK59_19860 [Paenibacillus odorifer]|uniref:hypothetical protein n=1 Tax=Paenibacillus odorifer TaxID=189426 RepID=UPI00096EFBAC|nr:hypothetical protein [Paenibacillus odorifer]OME51781.1 hypothetical protein BSK59_19860 [Paenibacillus odorifer]